MNLARCVNGVNTVYIDTAEHKRSLGKATVLEINGPPLDTLGPVKNWTTPPCEQQARRVTRYSDSRRSLSMRMCVLFCIALVCALSSGGFSLAAQRRAVTNTGIPLDERIAVRIKGTLLRVPAGYLWPATSEVRRRENNWEGLDFAFWMPDRRYPEVPLVSRRGFRPREPGRDAPRAEAYVVEVRHLK